MKFMMGVAAVAAVMACTPTLARTYLVSEPPPAARKITLKLTHPGAKVNPVRSERVEGLTVGELRQRLRSSAGLWQDAALDCAGGYNPALAISPTYDFLAFDIASSSRGDAALMASFADNRTVHELCMAKALQQAARMNASQQ